LDAKILKNAHIRGSSKPFVHGMDQLKTKRRVFEKLAWNIGVATT